MQGLPAVSCRAAAAAAGLAASRREPPATAAPSQAYGAEGRLWQFTCPAPFTASHTLAQGGQAETEALAVCEALADALDGREPLADADALALALALTLGETVGVSVQ